MSQKPSAAAETAAEAEGRSALRTFNCCGTASDVVVVECTVSGSACVMRQQVHYVAAAGAGCIRYSASARAAAVVAAC